MLAKFRKEKKRKKNGSRDERDDDDGRVWYFRSHNWLLRNKAGAVGLVRDGGGGLDRSIGLVGIVIFEQTLLFCF